MKGKYFVTLGVSLLAIGATAGFVGTNHIVEVRADANPTPTTVYYAIASDVLGTYQLKLNVNRKGDGDEWQQLDMSPSGTYGDWDLYAATYTDLYGGAGAIQFQVYDGATHKWEDKAIKTWTLKSVYEGKVFVNAQQDWFDRENVPDTTGTADIYFNAYDWGNVYLYTYETISGGNFKKLGNFPGQEIGLSDSNLHFNGANKLQKITIPYANINNVRFVISDGTDSHKAEGLSLTSGAYYQHTENWGAHTGDIADAAAFVWDLNTARMAVAADVGAKIKDYSICGLNASTWVNRYNDGLSDEAREYVDAATIYTYEDAESIGADTTVTFADVMDTLSKRVSGGGILSIENTGENKSIPVITIAVIAAVVGIGFVSFVAFRRKKINL